MLRHSKAVLVLLSICYVISNISLAQAKPKRKYSATLYMDFGTKPRLQARTVGETLDQYLADLPRLKFTRLNEVLEPMKSFRRKVRKAKKLTAKGKEDISNLEVELGVAAIKDAVKLREQAFHLFEHQPEEIKKHAWMLGDLAMAHFLNGEEEKARQALLQAFGLFPKMEFDDKRFPPQMKRTFDETRFLADELGTGNCAVDTVPVGAEVRANGKYVGFAPLVVRGLPAGNNLITVANTGYRTKTMRTNIEGGPNPSELKIKLKPLRGRPQKVLQAALTEAQTGKHSGKNLATAGALLKRDLLLFADMSGRDDIVVVRLFAYDVRKKKIVGRVKSTVSAMDPDPECKEMASILMTALSRKTVTRPTPAARPKPKPAPTESWFSRFRKSNYFWPVVGGLAAGAVVAGVGVGIYYGTKGGPPDHRRTLLILPANTPGLFP